MPFQLPRKSLATCSPLSPPKCPPPPIDTHQVTVGHKVDVGQRDRILDELGEPRRVVVELVRAVAGGAGGVDLGRVPAWQLIGSTARQSGRQWWEATGLEV